MDYRGPLETARMVDIDKFGKLAGQIWTLLDSAQLTEEPEECAVAKLYVLCTTQALVYLHLQQMRGRPDNMQDWLDFATTVLDTVRYHVEAARSATLH